MEDIWDYAPGTPLPVIIVRRIYWDMYADGSKTVEYRRHRRPFTERVFFAGRLVRIAYHRNVRDFPTLLARVTAFRVEPARDHIWLRDIYTDLEPHDELALIGLIVRKTD